MNRISPPAPLRASVRAALSLLFTLALLTAGLAAPAAAAAGQRVKASQKRRAGAASKARTDATGRKSQARRGGGGGDAAGPLQASRQEHEAESDDAEKRENWFYFERAYPFGEIPADARRRAWESRPGRDKGGKILPHSQFVWTPIGPAPTDGFASAQNWGPTSGRINAVAVLPTSPKIILVGAATGGIWRSTDDGSTFAPVSDSQVDLSVGSIAFAPSNPNVVYAGMGDVDNSYVGTGILKSTDAGATWTRINNATFPAQGFVADILVDPTNPDRVYVAQDRALNASGSPANGYVFPDSGVWVSNDGGVSWAAPAPGGRARSLAIHPTNPQIVYAGMRSIIGGGTAGVYKSTDRGVTWNVIYVSPYSTLTRDIQVAVTPAAPENVYVYVGRTVSPREIRIEVSTDGGANWSSRSAGGVTNIDTGQFGYNTYIKVSPASASTIYVGARDIFKTTNGDQTSPTWTNITRNFHNPPSFGTYNPFQSNTHPDQQALAFDPNNADVIYAGNDGGISKSTDAGLNFTSLNQTLSLTQFVHLSLHPTNAAISYGGTQDNGTQRRLEGTSNWKEFSSGDGGRSVINPADNSMVFTTYVYGSVSRYTSNGADPRNPIAVTTTFGETDANGAAPRIAFYPPVVGNGVDHRLYFGSWKLFVCNDCNDTAKRIGGGATPPTWTTPALNTDLTKGNSDVLETIAVARANTNVIYTGSRQGRAMVSSDGGANWTDVTAGLPNRTIKSITVDPSNPAVAYLTVSGYGSGHVFRTTNFGASWADISNNLPNVPANAFLIDPQSASTFYVGTDVGVFRSTDGGASWETFNAGMPPVVVTAFAAQPTGRIQAATYGRGAYELTAAAVVNPTVQFAAAGATVGEGAGRATLTVTRSGDASAAATVDYSTADSDAFTVGCADAAGAAGAAYARCDFATTVGTLSFAPGEISKTVSVPVIDDAHAEGPETFQLRLSNATGATLGSFGVSTITITDNDAAGQPNPVSGPPFNFFVRQQYLDFLSREPDQGGFQAWLGVLNGCPNPFAGPQVSSGCDRIHVSGEGFFRSVEFQLKGAYVFRLYKAAFNRMPEYTEVVSDMSFIAGATEAEVFARRAGLAARFTERQEFTQLYGGRTNQQYVADLLGRYNLTQITTPDPASPDAGGKVVLTQSDLAARLDSGALTRAQVLRAAADSDQVNAAEFNNAFVAMQYYGYLRRKPEPTGFEAWLNVLQSGDARTMVNGFLNSAEYRLRFGTN
ncbi:MAG TPA: Calx-beta domain-containing protein [Pyrinomonadaceae bacterium]|nr:Calx-beta domain-containing protein [Pyrinomonadaceae bacterium]